MIPRIEPLGTYTPAIQRVVWSKALAKNSLAVEVVTLLLLAAVVSADAIAPPEFSAVLLYFIPLGVVAWLGTFGSQKRIAIIAILAWAGLDVADHQNRTWWLHLWVVLEKAVIFGGIVHLMARLRHGLQEQKELNRMLEERLRVIEQLAAGVAHEVRNPLGTLLLGVEYLGKHEQSSTKRGLIDDMHAAIVRAEVIVRDLMDFSAPLRLNLTPVNCNLVIEHANRESLARAVAAKVSIRMLPSPAAIVNADETRITQVLVNLVNNAIDASPAGSAVRIAAHIRRAPEKLVGKFKPGASLVCIEIDDAGSGIPEDQLSRIFEPFYTTKAPGAGTGLGLAVSHRIARDHGGLLELANLPCQGARATLTLPLGELV